MAANCWVVPLAMLAVAGVTEIDASAAAVTVNAADPLMLPNVALIVAEPAFSPFANPVALIVALVVSEELQTTDDVTSWLVPSESAPVAINCCVVPLAMLAAAGDTCTDMTVAGVTVTTLDPLTLPNAAVIVTEPDPIPSARPVPLIVASVVSDELQVTDEVTFAVLLFM